MDRTSILTNSLYLKNFSTNLGKGNEYCLTTPPEGLNIKIYSKRSGNERSSDEMFSVTVHETAHWSHATNSSASFTYAGNFIRESWAVGVEWFITQMEYKERGISNYADWDYFSYSPELPFPMFESYQYWVKGIHNADRSPLFIDLYDSFNQLNQTFHYSSNIPNIDDNVTGYTFQELESVVFSVRSSVLEGLRSLLEANKPLGVSDVDLYRLMFNF